MQVKCRTLLEVFGALALVLILIGLVITSTGVT